MTSTEGSSGPKRQRSIKDRLKVGLIPSSWQSKSKSADQSLATNYDVDVLGGLNPVSGSTLGSSESENVPLGRPVTERRLSCSLSSRIAEETVTYTVQDNDTLNSVAARFDTTPSELATLNKLHSRLIFPGQVLYVPRKDPAESLASEDIPAVNALNISGSDLSRETPNISALASTPPEKNDEHAFLDNLRPPGSPRTSRPGAGVSDLHQSSDSDWSILSASETISLESERIKDRQLYDKFLRLDVRHITDGQGIVSGVLLVTPNTMMFDPNVSDPLVIEHGPEVYGMITQLDCVANAAMFADIALIKNNQDPDAQLDTVYYPASCSLHKKYEVLKKVLAEREAKEKEKEERKKEKEEEKEERKKEKEENLKEEEKEERKEEKEENLKEEEKTGTNRERAESFGEILDSAAKIPLEICNPVTLTIEDSGHVMEDIKLDLGIVGESTSDVTVETSSKIADSVECHSGRTSMDNGNAPGIAAAPGKEDEVPGSCVSSEELLRIPPKNPFASPLISVCKRTPSDEVPCEDLNDLPDETQTSITDKDTQKGDSLADKLETVSQKLEFDVQQPLGSSKVSEIRRNFESATKDYPSESEFRPRHHSAGSAAFCTPPRRGRFFRLAKGAAETGSPESASNFSSSPESRGQKMLKRLSYPLVWMGESLSTDSNTSKDNSAPNSAGYEETPSESVFSKVFSSSHRNFVDLSTGLFTRPPDQWPRVKDLKEHDPARSYLVPNASDLVNSGRRSSVETSNTSKATSKVPASKVGYRSMVSVDDVPELFASIDKLIPKPAKSCDDPPLYLRLRMAKPKRKPTATSHVMSYGMHRKKAVYWFSVPRDRADELCRFFLLWAPEVYGGCTTAELEKRGFVLMKNDSDYDAEDFSADLIRAGQGHKDPEGASGLGGAADYLARESWEIVSFQNELRRALSQAESDIYVPDRDSQSEIVNDEQIKLLALRLPARVAGSKWSLVFTTSQHGFSLNSLYRKMSELDSPVLVLIKDTQDNIFGAYSPVELRVSEHFYGTGEAFLFTFVPEFRVFHWSGENSYFVKGNNESLVFGSGEGKFGLWLDGDLYQGRSQHCRTFNNDPLNPDEDFLIRTVECWSFS